MKLKGGEDNALGYSSLVPKLFRPLNDFATLFLVTLSFSSKILTGCSM